jgi:uncharacterized protein (TIGR03000 family)
MLKNLWTTAIVGMVGMTLLLTPAVGEAQRRGGARVGGAYTGVRAPYYRGYGGWGFSHGWGYPGYYYYYGGRPYYYGYNGVILSTYPSYVYSPNVTNKSLYPATAPNEIQNANSAEFVVRLPDPNAEVWFQNYKTKQTGLVRQFESDALDPSSTYTFTVRARWNQNGQTVDQTRQVNARAGQNLVVDFTTAVREHVPALPQRTQ